MMWVSKVLDIPRYDKTAKQKAEQAAQHEVTLTRFGLNPPTTPQPAIQNHTKRLILERIFGII
jgi:hypothetical protein